MKVFGNDDFKSTLWAYNKFYGVETTNYKPEGSSLQRAEKIITRLNSVDEHNNPLKTTERLSQKARPPCGLGM